MKKFDEFNWEFDEEEYGEETIYNREFTDFLIKNFALNLYLI